jgi:hypothetical protein
MYPYPESKKNPITLHRASVIAQSLVHRDMERLIKKIEKEKYHAR